MIRCALRPAHELYGKTRVRDFGPRALKTCRAWLVSERDNARETANQYAGVIASAFKWGVENELVPAEVWHGLLAVRGLERGRCDARETDPVKPVPEAFVDAIRDHVNRHVWAMVQLQLLTGMRPGEVVQMRARDLDTTGPVWVFDKTEHQDKSREVYLGPRVQAIVKEFLVPDVGSFLFSPAAAEAERIRELREHRRTPVQPSQRDRRKRNPRRQPGPASRSKPRGGI